MTELTHIAASGEAHMVDVGDKAETARSATATGYVRMLPETLALIREGNAKKGDVIGPAKTDRGFEPAAVAAMSRIFAREAALKVASEGVRLLRGTPGLAPAAPGAIAAGLRLDLIEQAHEGLIDDMDFVRTALYSRPNSHR